jgi:predicted nucleic acid-binding protein
LKSWPLTWFFPEEEGLLVAGRFEAFYRLSFADALIAAVARTQRAILVHKDPELEALSGQVSLLSLPFKST